MSDASGNTEAEDPMDPVSFELIPTFVNRPRKDTNWGWTISEKPRGPLVEAVAPASPMGAANVMRGDYLVSVNGWRTKTIEDVESAVQESPINLRAVISRRRQNPLDVAALIGDRGPSCLMPNYEYKICRLDPTSCPRTGLKLGNLAGRLVVFSVDRAGAGAASGLKAADQLVQIGAAHPTNENQFWRLLNVVREDPIDVIVMRRSRPATMQIDRPAGSKPSGAVDVQTRVLDSGWLSAVQVDTLALDEGFSGEPSTGVPEIPSPVHKITDNARSRVLKSISSGGRAGAKKPNKVSNEQPKIADVPKPVPAEKHAKVTKNPEKGPMK